MQKLKYLAHYMFNDKEIGQMLPAPNTILKISKMPFISEIKIRN